MIERLQWMQRKQFLRNSDNHCVMVIGYVHDNGMSDVIYRSYVSQDNGETRIDCNKFLERHTKVTTMVIPEE